MNAPHPTSLVAQARPYPGHRLIGRVYYERGQAVTITAVWTLPRFGGGPDTRPCFVEIEHADGTRTRRSFRGLRKNPPSPPPSGRPVTLRACP